MGLGNGSEDCSNGVRDGDEDFDLAVDLVQSMLFLALNKHAILWVLSEVGELQVREESIEDVGVDFLLLDLMQLTLFNNL